MKKRYIILLIMLILYLVVLFVFFYKEEDKETKNNVEDYILFANNNFWKYDGERFISVYNKTNVIGKKDFYIYEDGIYKDRYSLGMNENTLYMFDKDNNSIDYNGEILGFTDNKNHKVFPLNTQPINAIDISNLEKVFSTHKISIDHLNYDKVLKYELDIDADGDLERIYNVSNMFDEEKIGKGYSLIFLEDSDKIYELISDVELNENSFSKGYAYYINNIADLDNDNEIDFIITRSSYGSPDICYLLMQKVKKEYRVTKNC